jgi:hypothetical protein
LVKFVYNTEDISINWETNDENTFKWVLYFQYDDKWDYKILNRFEKNASLLKTILNTTGKVTTLKNIIVSAVDRTGIESDQLLIPIS